MEKTFIELERVNRSNETKVVVLDLARVVAVTGIHTTGKNTDLFDENGEFVETKVVEDAPVRYRVMLDGAPTTEIILDQDNYDKLTKALLK